VKVAIAKIQRISVKAAGGAGNGGRLDNKPPYNPKEKAGCRTRQRAFAQMRQGPNIQLLTYLSNSRMSEVGMVHGSGHSRRVCCKPRRCRTSHRHRCG
jgi:hypothetical protein